MGIISYFKPMKFTMIEYIRPWGHETNPVSLHVPEASVSNTLVGVLLVYVYTCMLILRVDNFLVLRSR